MLAIKVNVDFTDNVQKIHQLVGSEQGGIRHNLRQGLQSPHDRFNLEDAEMAIELAQKILNETAVKFKLE